MAKNEISDLFEFLYTPLRQILLGMMGISGTGRYFVYHIDIRPLFAIFHIVIIKPHVVWVTIVGNKCLQIMTGLDLSDHAI